MLSEEHRAERVRCADLFLQALDSIEGYSDSIITVDETWVHHTTPETKQQSKQWLPKGSDPPKKAKVVLSAKKVMATIFFDNQGVVYTTYAEGTINSAAYIDALKEMNHKLSRKRPGKRGWNFRLHHDNARVHTSKATMEFLTSKGVEVVPHPPYSPDLAPCDFWFFPNLKKNLGGTAYTTDSEVKQAVGRVFRTMSKEDFEFAINEQWKKRWLLCKEKKGDFVEK